MAPIVAEIYGPDYAGQMEVAKQVRAQYAATADIVGIDDSVDDNAPKFVLRVLQNKAALAGIIVRNSILLVDFIRHARRPRRPLCEVLLEAGAIRFKPILLTAIAAMIGAAVILADPIFQGLAISLLFGVASSTVLTILVIPAIYVVLRGDRQ
jgi:multidrug efflux pump subunit AcrB